MSGPASEDYYAPCKDHVQLLEPIKIPPWDQLAPQVSLIVESLATRNFAVLDNFIDPEEAAALRAEVLSYWRDGRMVDGEIGRGAASDGGFVNEKMRTDKIMWLEGNEPHVLQFMRRHVLRMDILTQKIACLLEALHPELAWEGAGRSKIMATCYPGSGARYVAHYDNPNQNGRKLTTILYLNDKWKVADGGVLRLKSKGVMVDVAPLFNRLLVFWSDRRCPHEVLPTSAAERFAITIWFLDEHERRAAMKRAVQPAAA